MWIKYFLSVNRILFGKGPGGRDSWDGWDSWDSWDQQETDS